MSCTYCGETTRFNGEALWVRAVGHYSQDLVLTVVGGLLRWDQADHIEADHSVMFFCCPFVNVWKQIMYVDTFKEPRYLVQVVPTALAFLCPCSDAVIIHWAERAPFIQPRVVQTAVLLWLIKFSRWSRKQLQALFGWRSCASKALLPVLFPCFRCLQTKHIRLFLFPESQHFVSGAVWSLHAQLCCCSQ